MKVAVSACLLGHNCKYNGKNNLNEKVLEFVGDKEVVPVCPELLGGLPCPRSCCEIVGNRILTADGRDCTENFIRGAELALKTAMDNKAELVVLQSRSPSCGVKQVYDGTFTGRLIDGQGVFARLATEHGLKVLDAEDL